MTLIGCSAVGPTCAIRDARVDASGSAGSQPVARSLVPRRTGSGGRDADRAGINVDGPFSPEPKAYRDPDRIAQVVHVVSSQGEGRRSAS
jgi:hypothetical protein